MEQNKANGSVKSEPVSQSSNTAPKLQKTVPGVPFAKGADPRRNLKGRPKSFDQCRELAQSIAHEELKTQSGDVLTVAEAILRSWAKSKEPFLQNKFIEIAFGKVPDKLETILEDRRTLKLHWPHERQDLAHTNGSTNRDN